MRRWLFRFFSIPVALMVVHAAGSWIRGDTVPPAASFDVSALQRDLMIARTAEATARRCATELREVAPALLDRGLATRLAALQTNGTTPSRQEDPEVQVAVAAALEEITKLTLRANGGAALGAGPAAAGSNDLGTRAQLIADVICAARNVAQAASSANAGPRHGRAPKGSTHQVH